LDRKNQDARNVLVMPERKIEAREPANPQVAVAPAVLNIGFVEVAINLKGYARLLLLVLPVGCVQVLGGWRMMRLQCYGWSLCASIVAMLPLTPGWLVGFPMGIWALAVLVNPNVRAAFRS
jgi:hypothetical protein